MTNFYGDVDFIPTEAFTEAFTEAEARNAIAGARFVVETVGKFSVFRVRFSVGDALRVS